MNSQPVGNTLNLFMVFIAFVAFGFPLPAQAHHTLGINQSGKATESPQIPLDQEILAGDYLFHVTVMPGNPQPHQLTRVIVYAKNQASGKPYLGEMHFEIKKTSWFRKGSALLSSVQTPIDDRFIQTYEFPSEGPHVVQLEIHENEESFGAEFPLRVGEQGNAWQILAGVLGAGTLAFIYWKARKNRRRLRPV